MKMTTVPERVESDDKGDGPSKKGPRSVVTEDKGSRVYSERISP